MNLVFVIPHFAPDIAPTGEVMTKIVSELARRGHRIEVVTSLPWYRSHAVEPGFAGRLVRREDQPWGTVTRIHPFPAEDKRSLVRRGLAFVGFSTLAAIHGSKGPDADAVLALSPPLTLGLAGWAIARARNAPLVFNIQDVFPDIAVELGAMKDGRIVAAARRLERFLYARSSAVTVLSEDLRRNVESKVEDASKVRVIPNFVDTETITPRRRDNSYRREFGLSKKTVIMYAGNVGLSQPIELIATAASALTDESGVVFVVNGGGAGWGALERAVAGLSNVVLVPSQPAARLPEVLAAADIHLVLLRKGLGHLSVPSKTYSILAAGRPLIAAVDHGTEVQRVVETSGAGVAVPPEDPEALVKAIRSLLNDANQTKGMGRRARAWIEEWPAPADVASAYEELFTELMLAMHPRS
ncbi:MAG TPA: glycosyltransferase family 4 protein [Actinomycetota bacterium]|nr:glycosyltransferase family 4 protein [Actinomycetota bacterium]